MSERVRYGRRLFYPVLFDETHRVGAWRHLARHIDGRHESDVAAGREPGGPVAREDGKARDVDRALERPGKRVGERVSE